MLDFKETCLRIFESEDVTWEEAEALARDRISGYIDYLNDRRKEQAYEEWANQQEQENEQE